MASEASLTLNELLTRASIEWHGVRLGAPDWSDGSHSLAFTMTSLQGRYRLHAMLNAYWEPLTFELPAAPVGSRHEVWRRIIDTALPSPDDFTPWETGQDVTGSTYTVQPRAMAWLALALVPDVRALQSRI